MDILIVPGGSGAGVQRTLVLDAFGSGLAVVTGGDALVGPLNDESITLRVSPPTDPTAWAAAIGGLLSNQPHAREVGWAARSWVRTNRSASAHVAAVLKVYDDLARRASSARDARIVESAA
jgi:glycosyltransferase involved in cell wall biosynthesis